MEDEWDNEKTRYFDKLIEKWYRRIQTFMSHKVNVGTTGFPHDDLINFRSTHKDKKGDKSYLKGFSAGSCSFYICQGKKQLYDKEIW